VFLWTSKLEKFQLEELSLNFSVTYAQKHVKISDVCAQVRKVKERPQESRFITKGSYFTELLKDSCCNLVISAKETEPEEKASTVEHLLMSVLI